MDDGLSIVIGKILSIQSEIINEKRKTRADCRQRALRYSAAAEEITAKREIMRTEFSERRAEVRRMYESANQTLDLAIKDGDLELARIAMIVIQNTRKMIRKGDL